MPENTAAPASLQITFASSEWVIMGYIAHARSTGDIPSIVKLLREGNPVFKGREISEITRIRGYAFDSFKELELPRNAMSHVTDELQNNKHPYLIAAAARSLRGQKTPYTPALPYLLKALNNLPHGNDTISFEDLNYSRPSNNATTAFGEILATFQWYGAYARPQIPALQALNDTPPFNLSDDNKSGIIKTIVAIENDPREVGTQLNAFASLTSAISGLFKKKSPSYL